MDNLNVLVQGKPARIDEAGNFFAAVKLREGANLIKIQVGDAYGNSTTLTRRVVFSRSAR
jgi:hypothetical protein